MTQQSLRDHPYLIVVSGIVTILLLHAYIGSSVGLTPAFLLFFCVIAAAAWLGGTRTGSVAAIASIVAADFFLIPPVDSFFGKTVLGWVNLAAFALVAFVILSIFNRLLTSRDRLIESVETTEAALARAEESNSMKRNFIANMSHEIRSPLSAILGYSDLLAAGDLSSDERKNYLERLRLNASSLTDLVSDLLDVTEIDSAYFVANRRWMELPAFVQKVLQTFKPLAQEKGLKMQVQLRGSIPSYIETDPEQLMQIIRHIVGNAIRHTDQGLIKLTVAASKTPEGRREAAFIIADQGSGISADIKQKLFSQSGTGLGLMVARKLARGLGGDVKLVKSDRRGTTFLITIDGGPVNEAQELFERIADVPGKDQLTPDNPHALEGTRVVVVDDSPDSALLVRRMLETVGAEVQTCLRAQEGVDKALEAEPDVVLMDIQMPEIDGNEATRRLRQKGFKKPIIALSAHVMKEDRDESARAGTNDFLMKPVSRRALLETVGRFIHSKRTNSPEVSPAHT